MFKLLVIITCIVVLTIHWNDFTEIIDLAKMISKLTETEIEFGDQNHGDSLRRLPDLTLNEKISWKANTSLEQGLNQLL